MAIIPYDRIINLQNDQALNPTDPYPAPEMDAEYNAIKITTDDIIQHIDLITNDDGTLANGSVGRDQLDPTIPLGFGAPSQWATGISYQYTDTVFFDNKFYFCEIDHVSTVFADDLAAGKWSLIVDFQLSTTEAEAAAAAAAESATDAASSAIDSQNSAEAAADSATAAANSASAASAANSFPWKYDISVVMADPGVGEVRFNNAAPASVTQIVLSAWSMVTGNPDVSDWIVTWDDSTNGTKGYVTVRKALAPQNFAIYRVIGPVLDVGLFLQLQVAYVTHAGTFTSLDQLNVEFARTGDSGITTVTGGINEAPTDGNLYGRKDAAWSVVQAMNAVGVAFAPSGNIQATNVQAAIQELDNEKAALKYSDGAPPAPLDNTFWWESDTGTLFIRYNDGNGAPQWVQAAPSADSSLFVAKNGDTMTGLLALSGDPTANLHAATKQYVDSRPFSSLMQTGIQLNGAMNVRQGVTGLFPSGYFIDCWIGTRVGTMVGNFIGSDATGLYGFPSMISFQVTTAQTVLGANDYAGFQTKIEGQRSQLLGWGTAAATPVTLSFWTKHHTPGIYSVSIRNNPLNRSCVMPYAQNVSDVWEYKTVTFPGDIAGSWGTLFSADMTIDFLFAGGTAVTAPSTHQWLAGSFLAAPGQVNAVATVPSNQCRMTGLMVLLGAGAPTAAQSPLFTRAADEETPKCQRFFEAITGTVGVGQAISATIAQIYVQYNVTKRVVPVINHRSAIGNFQVFSNLGVTIAVANHIGIMAGSATTRGHTSHYGTSGLVAGNATSLFASTQGPGAMLEIDARL